MDSKKPNLPRQVRVAKGKPELLVWCRAWFFNPFKKRGFGEIIPIFQFIPQIGVQIERTMTGWIGTRLYFGWLNFTGYLYVSVLRRLQLISEED